MIDIGRYVAANETVNSAAAEGARFGSAVGQTSSSIPQYLDCDAIRSAAAGAQGVIDVVPANITVAYDEGPGTGTNQTCPIGGPGPNDSTITAGDRIVVTVTADFFLLTPGISNFFGGSLTLTSTDRRTIFKS